MPHKDPIAKAEYHAQYHQDNKALKAAHQKKFFERNRAAVDDYKRSRGCRDCGTTNPIVLVFHHRDTATKNFTIGKKMHKLCADKLLAEASNCDILCSNCHLIEHSLNKEPFKRSPGRPKQVTE